MRFYSSARMYRVTLQPSGLRPVEGQAGIYNEHPPVVAQFRNFTYDTDWTPEVPAEEQARILRRLKEYGWGRQVWSEEDKPEEVRMEDELVRLRAENDALRKATEAKIVYVDKPVEKADKPENGLQKMHRLRKEAQGLGFETRGMNLDDLEAAIASAKAEASTA